MLFRCCFQLPYWSNFICKCIIRFFACFSKNQFSSACLKIRWTFMLLVLGNLIVLIFGKIAHGWIVGWAYRVSHISVSNESNRLPETVECFKPPFDVVPGEKVFHAMMNINHSLVRSLVGWMSCTDSMLKSCRCRISESCIRDIECS